MQNFITEKIFIFSVINTIMGDTNMIEKCKYCNKDIIIKNPNPSRGSLHNHISKCAEYKTFVNTRITPDFISKEYINLGKSAKQIHDEFGYGVTSIINKIREFGFHLRSISEAKKMPNAIVRGEQTCLELYNARHPMCRESSSRVAWQKRLFDKEGITTVFQRPEVIEQISKTMAGREGDRMVARNRISSIHKKIFDYIRSRNIVVEIELGLHYNINRWRFFDLYLSDYNLIIEAQGDKFHANPKKYKPADLIDDFFFHGTVQDIWDKDRIKEKLALNAGYKLLYFWEDDINHHFDYVKGVIEGQLDWRIDEDCKIKICNESRAYLKTI